MYINSVILEWDLHVCSSHILNQDWRVPYTYVNHAELIAAKPISEVSLIDSIANLKRAIDHRLKWLSQNYKLKRIAKLTNTKGNMDTLVSLEVIKPRMVDELLKVRNALEHKFERPPKQERCIELAEMVWYFLKSTDQLSKLVSSEFTLKDELYDDYFFQFNGSPDNDWGRSFYTRISNKLVSEAPREGYFEVAPESVKSISEVRKDANSVELLDIMYPNLADEDLVIDGKVECEHTYVQLLRKYFVAA